MQDVTDHHRFQERVDADLFRGMSCETRIRILQLLLEAKGPMNVTDITARLSCVMAAVSRHLHKMVRAGILVSTRRGKHVLYDVDPSLGRKLRSIVEVIEGEFSRDGAER